MFFSTKVHYSYVQTCENNKHIIKKNIMITQNYSQTSYCVIPETIHTHLMDGHWKLRGVGVLR